MADSAGTRVGIGLPAAIPGARPGQIVEWARRSEAAGFASLATLDRLVYDNYEPLVTLGAAAAVTERIGLGTYVLLAPNRGPSALLASQAATLDRLSGGRFTLGLGVGTRPDDYRATGADFGRRGRRLDEVLTELHETWTGRPGPVRVGPAPSNGRPRIVLGGRSGPALDRVGRFGDGWIAGSTGFFAEGAAAVRAAWRRHGRDGAPRLMAVAYFALGEDGARYAREYLTDYYAFVGAGAAAVADSALTTPDAVRDTVAAMGEAGCDELVLFPCRAEPAQVDLLAAALG
ncbi:LLM class flavin-dependent oxidoreductase [Pseudonocardia bannensis]|uniref:LLM class flavin-dependent oxidoreductase n=1 Tax=Pseudonocardia bannensis TaxID=630973 RepID=A0A848DBK3_9PSEU|nr:LLM class flavin-dependent oxidoreductase [Pseudonocardia bannensis]NMH90200.1 LLM class flavin-dependent oxidoreductase [Pseudonocardia bannensis]